MSDASPGGSSDPFPVPYEPGAADLPIPLTSMVGREHEMAAAIALLRRDDVRLLTMTGPGGVGKTRLALQVAQALDSAGAFPDGVTFVSLAPLIDPELVLPAVAQALRLREVGDEAVMDRLVRALRPRRALLVLDNFEQVIAAASPVVELLRACPGLSILATSRQALPLNAQHRFPVQPLTLPGLPDAECPLSMSEIERADAVTLFVQRASAVDPGFALTPATAPVIAEICRRLDGLPLAIELAAARCNVLSPQALLTRLEQRLPLLVGGSLDLPVRQRTLRSAIAWSCELLDSQEQTLFRRLAVFVDGIAIDAAEAVASGGGPRSEAPGPIAAPAAPGPMGAGTGDAADSAMSDSIFVLDALASLVDKSLLRREAGADGEPRFRMLDTIREYGLERLEASGEAEETRGRHAEWCLALAERAWADISSRANAEHSLDRLQAEHANLRAALAWLDETGHTAECLRLTGSLAWFWYFRDHWREGRGWLERALARGASAPRATRARALFGAALLAHYCGDEELAVALAEQSLVLCRDLGDPFGTANALFLLGVGAEDRGAYESATSRLGEAAALLGEAGESFVAILTTFHLGVVAYGQGDHLRAEALLEEALGRWRSAGDARGEVIALTCLGLVASERGDAARAVPLHAEALDLIGAAANKHALTFCLPGIGVLAAARGQPERAARLFGATAALNETLGSPFALPERAVYERATETARRRLGENLFAIAWAVGREMPAERAMAEAEEVLALTLPAASALETTAMAPPPPASASHALTVRELEVLRLLAAGHTSRMIAETLFISVPTVKTHITNIFAKLGLSSRAAAIAYAHRHGIV